MPPAPAPVPAHSPPLRRRRLWLWGGPLLVLLACGLLAAWDYWHALPTNATAQYTGRATCLECHAAQGAAFHGSDHDLAMDVATDETVLGNFHNAELTVHGVTSRMFRRGKQFFVNTEGPDGRLADFEVKYVFGVRPLQQYLVEFDRPANMPEHEIARMQVLPLSWDTAGQKWFHLAPPDAPEKLSPDDPLHWTGTAFNWNHMCADCHSTNVKKGYDVATRTYHTTFSEIDVSCETCHGPGSLHVQLAREKWLFWDRHRGYALPPLKDANARVEVETCAACHSRRQPLVEDPQGGQPFHDCFMLGPLTAETYFPDGQILDEVYEYGSFVQSKMYHKNIRCTDCHDAHTTRVKDTGNQLCTSCHAHPAGKYDSPSHHRHLPHSPGAQCVECHMPGRYYMEVDFRRDHSLRIPRPDLSVALGVPNACSACHFDLPGMAGNRHAAVTAYTSQVAQARQGNTEARQRLTALDTWARDKVTEWYGPKYAPADHFAPDLAAAWRGEPGANTRLEKWLRRADVSAMVRSSMLLALERYGGEQTPLRLSLLADSEPQVRALAASGLDFLSPRDKLTHLAPLLSDPARAVRHEVVPVLLAVPAGDMNAPQRERLALGLDEYRVGTLLANDRAGSHLLLGQIYLRTGNVDGAERALRTALEVEPRTVGPAAMLAALLAARAADRLPSPRYGAPQTEAELAAAIESTRREAEQFRARELEFLARDARLAPRSGLVRHNYGLALQASGQRKEALAELLAAHQLEPYSVEVVQSLVDLHMQEQRWGEAATWAQRLLELRPGVAEFEEQRDRLRALEKSPPPKE